jgi:hypothetical protein
MQTPWRYSSQMLKDNGADKVYHQEMKKRQDNAVIGIFFRKSAPF